MPSSWLLLELGTVVQQGLGIAAACDKPLPRLTSALPTSLCAGAKLFYLSGLRNGKYLKREVHNLARFIRQASVGNVQTLLKQLFCREESRGAGSKDACWKRISVPCSD